MVMSVQEHVARFHVAVDDASFVGRAESLGDLGADPGGATGVSDPSRAISVARSAPWMYRIARYS